MKTIGTFLLVIIGMGILGLLVEYVIAPALNLIGTLIYWGFWIGVALYLLVSIIDKINDKAHRRNSAQPVSAKSNEYGHGSQTVVAGTKPTVNSDLFNGEYVNIVNTYQSLPHEGIYGILEDDIRYIRIESPKVIEQDEEYLRKETRKHIIYGSREELCQIVRIYMKDGKLPGKIVVREYVEDDLPDKFEKMVLENEAEKSFVKKARPPYIMGYETPNHPAPTYLLAGKEILRFKEYIMFPSADDVDRFVPCDNLEEIESYVNREYHEAVNYITRKTMIEEINGYIQESELKRRVNS